MRLIITIFSLFIASISFGQIFENPITDSNPSSANPFTAGQSVDPNISASGIGRGVGINANAGSNRYNSNNWNSASLDADDYFTFTLTPNSGYTINFSALNYTAQASGTGPSSFAFRSSLDGFTSDIGTPTSAGATISLSGPAYQNITTAIEFRIYGWAATSSTGTFSVNDFSFTGNVVLPIVLSQISVTNQSTTNTLNWETATEINNSHFEILHSTDARSYTTIGKELGNGNTTENISYSYDHQNVKPGTHYYQLRQVDYDGNSEIFGPISVSVTGKTLRFFPSVAENMIHFEGPMDNENYSVFSLDGKTIKSGKVTSDVMISDIPKGVYYIKYGNQTSQLIKL